LKQAASRPDNPEFDEIYYSLEGEGILYIDDQPHSFKPHSYYLLPRNTRHWPKADSRLRLLCVRYSGYTHEGAVLESM
jgi:mannose-6-phosphate isomerase-like protein (cupin superfamily)